MIQRVLSQPSWFGRLTEEGQRALTPLFLAHVNPYGWFRLDMNETLAIERADEAAT
jgi:hypothetical protein